MSKFLGSEKRVYSINVEPFNYCHSHIYSICILECAYRKTSRQYEQRNEKVYTTFTTRKKRKIGQETSIGLKMTT